MSLKTLIYFVVIIGGLGGGGWMIYDYRASIPPDLDSATPAQLVDYTLTRHFDKMSEFDRQKFIEETMGRYAAMTDAEREQVEAVVAKMREDNPDQLKNQMMKFYKGFFIGEARSYVELPPAERAAWLDARMGMWLAIANQRNPEQREKEEAERKRREKEGEGPLTPERQQKIFNFFKKEILPNSTAEERALFVVLMKDASPKFEKLRKQNK